MIAVPCGLSLGTNIAWWHEKQEEGTLGSFYNLPIYAALSLRARQFKGAICRCKETSFLKSGALDCRSGYNGAPLQKRLPLQVEER